MKKKVLTLGLAMSLVAAPYALAEQAEDVEQEVNQVVEEADANAVAPVEEKEVTEEGATEEEAIAEEATEEAVEEEAAAEEATEETVEESAAVELTDVEQSWAKEEIKTLVETDIISGFPDGTFQPAANMTRDQFAKVLALSLGLEENEAANPFTDAGWAAPYIGALVKAELTQGLTENLYGSKENVTREQLAVFFVRALGFEEEVKNLELELKFADSDQIASYSRASVAFLSSIDFIKGIEKDGKPYFNPKGNADRQAVARLAYEFAVNGEAYQEKGQALLESLTSNKAEVDTEEDVTEEATAEEQVTEEPAAEDVVKEDQAAGEGTDTEEATHEDPQAGADEAEQGTDNAEADETVADTADEGNEADAGEDAASKEASAE